MFLASFTRALCLLLLAQNKFGVARDGEGLSGAIFAGTTASGESDVLDKLTSGVFGWKAKITPSLKYGFIRWLENNARGRDWHPAIKKNYTRPFKRSENRSPFLNDLGGSTLTDLASRVAEILDRISRNWALEGAKTIQNGEIRLRKLNKNLDEKISELLTNGSKYGKHVSRCMNKTVFEIGLEQILDETTECYSKSLLAVERQLKRIEEEERTVLERMESYGISMFDMLSDCFLKESVPAVIECLQRVDGTDIGSHIQDGTAAELILEITGLVNDIPRTFSGCTSKSLIETEAHVRKGYAQSLSCLKEHVT